MDSVSRLPNVKLAELLRLLDRCHSLTSQSLVSLAQWVKWAREIVLCGISCSIDAIPVLGHIKGDFLIQTIIDTPLMPKIGIFHILMGNPEACWRSEVRATRTTVVTGASFIALWFGGRSVTVGATAVTVGTLFDAFITGMSPKIIIDPIYMLNGCAVHGGHGPQGIIQAFLKVNAAFQARSGKLLALSTLQLGAFIAGYAMCGMATKALSDQFHSYITNFAKVCCA
jgi:hypothetical protein